MFKKLFIFIQANSRGKKIALENIFLGYMYHICIVYMYGKENISSSMETN